MKTIEEKAKAFAGKAMIECKQSDVPFDLTQSAALGMYIRDAYLAGATEALAGQWRRVEDELPKAEQDVFVAVAWGNGYSYGYAWLSTLSNGTLRWYSHDDYLHLDYIRYWMPIPEPPKYESE